MIRFVNNQYMKKSAVSKSEKIETYFPRVNAMAEQKTDINQNAQIDVKTPTETTSQQEIWLNERNINSI